MHVSIIYQTSEGHKILGTKYCVAILKKRNEQLKVYISLKKNKLVCFTKT